MKSAPHSLLALLSLLLIIGCGQTPNASTGDQQASDQEQTGGKAAEQTDWEAAKAERPMRSSEMTGLEAQEAAPDPDVPELKPLQRFIGSWDQHVVIKISEWAPENTTMDGDATTNWILRGRVIEHSVIWSPDNTHGLSLIAYDTENKVYRQWYFDSNGTIPRDELRGEWDEATKTITWKGRLPNGITVTGDHRFVDEDTYEWSLTHKDPTGKVVLLMESKVKRKPQLTRSSLQERGSEVRPPELQPLQRFIGSWEQQVVSKPAAWTPERTVMTCPSTVNGILGGRMIEHRYVWSPGDTHGLCLMAYDTENKEYRQWYFDSDGGMPRGENRGRWDEVTKTFTWKGTSPNGVTSTQIHRFIDHDRQEWTLVFKDSTGKVLSDREAKVKRKPSVTHSDAQRQGGKAPPPEMKVLDAVSGQPVHGKGWTVPGLGIEFVFVREGSFRMGSDDGDSREKPVHQVRITRPFWMGTCEVTRAEFGAFAEARNYRTTAEQGAGAFVIEGGRPIWKRDANWRTVFISPENPVVCVSWDDGVAFCEWLTERERGAGRLPAGYEYRLPSEAEWEYSARGGPDGRETTYSGSDDPGSVAWCQMNSGDRARDDADWNFKQLEANNCRSHPVGGKGPNELGLHDMSGNVWEWCLDWSASYGQSPREDPLGPSKGRERVTRGGSWGSTVRNCRVATRSCLGPWWAGSITGFRVALAPSVRSSNSADPTPENEPGKATAPVDNLKTIGIAMRNFHTTYKHFPPAVIYGPDGKPWHSWRVLLLPYLEQARLYDQYRFDEPWDGPNNKKLLDKMPSFYRDPVHGERDDYYTHYAVPTGDAVAFTKDGIKMVGDGKRGFGSLEGARQIRDFTDGASNSILAGSVSPERKIPWMKPEDVVVAEGASGSSGLGGFAAPHVSEQGRVGVFLFADGTVRAIRNDVDPSTFRALLTIASADEALEGNSENKRIKEDALDKEMKALAGTWKAVSRETDGKKVPDSILKEVVITRDESGKTVIRRGDTVVLESTIKKLDTSKKPKTIDTLHTVGELKGKTVQGIYEIDGDMLRVCMAPPGRERPSEFSAKAGSGNSLVVYTREKK